MDWQPIETAPKDGTPIRGLYDDGRPEDEAIEDGLYWSEERYCILGAPQGSMGPGWVSREAGDLPVDAPAYWMPLPAPPLETAGG